MSDKKWLVPDVIDPVGKVCVQLEIPNDVKHIAAFWGALEQLGKAYNWEDSYADGSLSAYVWQDVLEGASEDVKTGVNCMLDCDEVEDCLETSTIINIIEGDIITNETNIVTNETNITNNETNITNIVSGGNDSNVYPPLPTPSDPDALCGASHEVAREIIALVEQTVIDAGAITLAAWLLPLLGLGGWLGTQLSFFWTYIFANQIALTGVDFDVYQEQMAEALYCADLDRIQAITILDPTIPALRRDALIKGLESATDAQIALWAFVGSLDDTEDCTGYACDWCYEFDFLVDDGGFIPNDGGAWSPDFGVWAVGVGWQAIHATLVHPADPEANVIELDRAFTATNILSVEMTYDYTIGFWSGATTPSYIKATLAAGSPSQQDSANPDPDGVDKVLTLTLGGGGAVKDSIKLRSTSAYWFNSGSGHALGSVTVKKMKVTGTGTNPFGASNC